MKDSSLSDPTLEHSMESLENKLDRLPPEQRKEVEDFVDFLLFRSGNIPAPPAAGQTPLSFQNVLLVVKIGSPTITWTTASLNKNHLQPLLR